MRRFLRRRRWAPAFLVSLLALFAALTGVAYGATSGGLRVGRINKSSKGTTLRSRRGPTLTLTNTGGKPAAKFNVLSGKPPFAVNSSVKVAGLDADLIDGLDSSFFQRRLSGTCAAGSAIQVVNADGSVVCASTLSSSWGLTGNSGTTSATNFLGTTDAQPLVIRTNNNEALRITTDGNVGIGTTTPGARLDATTTNAIAVQGTSNGSDAGVLGKSSSGPGLEGESTNGAGGTVGVLGLSATQPGVVGSSNSSDGVRGTANTGDGVHGLSDSGSAVNGNSASGDGVDGHSGTQTGVSGSSDSGDGVTGSASTGTGVFGLADSGVGALGASTSGDGTIGISVTANGVGGTSDSGIGVTGVSTSGDGVRGKTSHPAGGGPAAAVDAINTGGGDIFIGQTKAGHVARIDSSGTGFFNGGTKNSGADYAESMRASVNPKTLAPGDVLAIDPQHSGQVRLSDGAESQLVAGVYSTKPSVLAVGNHGVDDHLAGNVPVAMLGIVPTKVSAEGGTVKPGDLLTTARTPGYAMKASSVVVRGVAIYPTGAILGKALESLRKGRGVIEVLVTLR